MSKIFDLDLDNTGGYPRDIMQASDGLIYGVAISGGVGSSGVNYVFDPIFMTYSKLFDFNHHYKGDTPHSIIKASDGKLYGMTTYGGNYNKGVLYSYDQNNGELLKLIDFSGSEKGEEPKGGLVEADNGKLYGMTMLGGSLNKGVLFSYNIQKKTFEKKHDFDMNYTGGHPAGSLIQVSNGKLYGKANGHIFSFDPSDDLLAVVNNSSSSYIGCLFEASNGKLYGTTHTHLSKSYK